MKKHMITRRAAIKTAAAFATTAAILPRALAQSVINGRFLPLFSVPALPYQGDSLQPYIDAKLMQQHHDLIHAAYVDSLNAAVSNVPDFYFDIKARGPEEARLEFLLKNTNLTPSSIRTQVHENAGGHYNHSIFWQMMKKNGGQGPQGELAEAIGRDFGGFNAFKEALTQAAVTLFGSGWAWLTIDSGKLKVEVTANEDAPLTRGRSVLLGIDVWEHAYYLQYQSRRADYISAWWRLVNWEFVGERYSKFKS